MLKFLQKTTWGHVQKRFFLSQAYHCEELWEKRLNSPILTQVQPESLYIDIDQRYSRTKIISAVDVDIFANSIKNNDLIDELIDIIHKLRLSAESSNILKSTNHALIRLLTKNNRINDLISILDDRLNYGIFMDDYDACLLLNILHKNKDYLNGTRLATVLMLQEDFSHPFVAYLSLLHCFNYLKKPVDWPEVEKIQETEEEVKIRVKYLRNKFFDDHFDLKEPFKLIGKTLAMISKDKKDDLEYSFNILGLALHEKTEKAQETIKEASNKNIKLYKEVIELIPKENEINKLIENLQMQSGNVLELLENKIKQAERLKAEKDIAKQCEKFLLWEDDRKNALEAQKNRINTSKRIENVEELQKALKEKETRLWFFENEEQIELAIEAKKIVSTRTWPGKKKKPRKIDEAYVPPEIIKKRDTPTT